MHSDNRRLILDFELNHSMSEGLLDIKLLIDTNQAVNLEIFFNFGLGSKAQFVVSLNTPK